jgi:hypothetical protein
MDVLTDRRSGAGLANIVGESGLVSGRRQDDFVEERSTALATTPTTSADTASGPGTNMPWSAPSISQT